MDMIAITTIQRTVKPGKAATENSPAVPPKVETIASGDSFTAKAEEAEELISLGAAREDKAKKKAPAKKAPAKQADTGTPKAPEDMTMDEIRAELDTLEAEYSSSANKDELVKALTDARSDDMV